MSERDDRARATPENPAGHRHRGPEETAYGHAHVHEPPTVAECSEALLRVFEFLDGEMAPADHAKIRAHLDACSECLRQYDLDQMVKHMVKRSCAPQAAPSSLRATIMRSITVIRVDPTL